MAQKPSDQLLESLSALVDGEASELELHRILKSFSEDEELQNSWLRFNAIRSVIQKEDSATSHITIDPAQQLNMVASIRTVIDAEDAARPLSDTLLSKVELSAQKASTSQGEQSTTDNPKRGQAWQAWLGKSALAASVCAAFVIGLGQMQNLESEEQTAVLASAVGNTDSMRDPVGSTTLGAPLGFELPALESRTVSASSAPNYSPATIVVRNPLLVSSESYSDMRTQDILNQLHVLHAERASANGGLGMMPFARLSDMDTTSLQSK